MKSSNTVVTVVVIAAVLIAAYGVGLLVHRARTGNSSSGTSATEANEAQMREDTAKLSHGPGSGKKQDSPEMRAKLKEKRAETLEKMESATAEEKEQMRQEIRERFSGTQNAKPGQSMPGATPPQPVDPNSERTGAEPNAAGQR